MSSKHFNTLTGVTIVLIVISIYLATKDKQVEISFVRGQELISYFDTKRLTTVEVTKGDDKVVLQRQRDGFVVSSRSSYPADGGRLNSLIKDCLDITCVREISKSTDSHEELEVAGKSALTVRFLEGETEIVGLVIGKSEGVGRYVRRVNEDTVYLSEKNAYIDTKANDYIDRVLTEITTADVKKVEVTGNGQPYTIARKDSDLKLEGVPDGMVAKSGDVRQVAGITGTLSFSEFQSEAEVKDVEFKSTYTVTTEAGARYKFKLGKKGDKFLCKVTSDYVGPKQIDVSKIKDDPEAEKKQEAILKADTSVATFTKRHQSWVYELDDWSGKHMTKAFKDVIEEDKQFLRIEEKSIGKVEVTTDGKTYTIDSPKEGEVNLLGIPDGKKAKAFDHHVVFSFTTTLQWSERKKSDDKDLADLKFDSTYKQTLRDNEQFTFAIAKKDDKYYVKASAVFVGSADDKLPAAVIARGSVAKFNERHKDHIYEVGSNIAQMVRKFDELIEEDKQFLRIEEKSIGKVEVTTDGKTYTIDSPKEGEVNLLGIPDGKKAKAFDHHVVFSFTTTLQWSERKKSDDKDLADLKFDSTYKQTLRDNEQFTFAIAKKDDKYYVKASAVFVGSADDKLPAAVLARDSVAKFNERHKDHVYEVDGNITQMVRKFDELIVDADTRPEAIEASHILIAYEGSSRSTVKGRTKDEAKKKAEELHAKVIAAPDKFAELAENNSDGPSKDEGGSLPKFRFEEMAKPFSEAAFKLEPGEISGVVETEFGFHIIKRTK